MDAEERLRKVERELRAWRLGVALVAGCALLSGAQPKKKPKTLEAEKLVISDEQGRQRIILDTVWPDGDAYVTVLDARGTERAAFGVIDRGEPFFQLNDSKGRRRVVSDVIGGDPEVKVFDEGGGLLGRLPR